LATDARRLTFVVSSVIIVAVWWIYHAVLTFAGWYGFNGGIPAFSVALVGFVLFVGVLTERSRSVLCCSSACSPSDPDRFGRAC
jgi:hypothetical protein